MDEQELCRVIPDLTGGYDGTGKIPPTFCERVLACIEDFGGSFDITDGTNTDEINLGETLTFSATNGLTVLVGPNEVTYGLPTGTVVGQVLEWDGTEWAPATLTDLDAQTLSLVGYDLSISNGNTVSLLDLFQREISESFLALNSGTDVVISQTPQAGTVVKVYRNGIRQLVGVGNDYTIAGTTITFAVAFAGGEQVIVDYWS